MSEEIVCEWCGKPFSRPHTSGPVPRFCSAGHRQRAYEARAGARRVLGQIDTAELIDPAKIMASVQSTAGIDAAKIMASVQSTAGIDPAMLIGAVADLANGFVILGDEVVGTAAHPPFPQVVPLVLVLLVLLLSLWLILPELARETEEAASQAARNTVSDVDLAATVYNHSRIAHDVWNSIETLLAIIGLLTAPSAVKALFRTETLSQGPPARLMTP